MRPLQSSPPDTCPPIQSSVPPSTHSSRTVPSGPCSDDDRHRDHFVELDQRLKRIEKQLAVEAAANRLFLNLQEVAALLGVDQRALRPLLNNISKNDFDPTKLNYIPKGRGDRPVKWIHRSELDRFAMQWWRDSLVGPKSAKSIWSPSKPGLADQGAPDSDQAEAKAASESADRGLA